jgi:hypothetical protein
MGDGGRMPRFKRGDRVRIAATESVFAGVEGVVEDVQLNPRNIPQLDSYTLRFSWGEMKVFWGAQLESIENKPSEAA